MNISDRIKAGKALLFELEKVINVLGPHYAHLPEITKKAILLKAKMIKCYSKWGEPPELFEQIEQINSIIKKLEQLHNKHVTEM